MASMSEEQKEYEALELVKKLDQLSRWVNSLKWWDKIPNGIIEKL
jgi:hypothetical protein